MVAKSNKKYSNFLHKQFSLVYISRKTQFPFEIKTPRIRMWNLRNQNKIFHFIIATNIRDTLNSMYMYNTILKLKLYRRIYKRWPYLYTVFAVLFVQKFLSIYMYIRTTKVYILQKSTHIITYTFYNYFMCYKFSYMHIYTQTPYILVLVISLWKF